MFFWIENVYINRRGGKMNIKEIGFFIKGQRKKLGMTQEELSSEIGVSSKTVSKWECGNGLPDVSLMIPLCEKLGINVNELLSGKLLTEQEYQQHAEENMLQELAERKNNHLMVIIQVILGIMFIMAMVAIIVFTSLFEMEDYLRAIIVATAIVLMIFGIVLLCIADIHTGYYECKNCKTRFIPSVKAYVFGPHTITTRRLKCPCCGKKTFCKKVFSKK